VELFLNGESLGKRTITDSDAYRACWMIPFQAGELRAVVDGAEDVLATSGTAASIGLKSDVCCLVADGQAIAQVEVTLRDAQGHVAAAADEQVFYQVLGDAEIIGIENGKPDDLTPYAQRSRATFNGKALVYLRAGQMAGEVTLYAYTRTGLSAQCKLSQE